jgi:hypothetical protein
MPDRFSAHSNLEKTTKKSTASFGSSALRASSTKSIFPPPNWLILEQASSAASIRAHMGRWKKCIVQYLQIPTQHAYSVGEILASSELPPLALKLTPSNTTLS